MQTTETKRNFVNLFLMIVRFVDKLLLMVTVDCLRLLIGNNSKCVALHLFEDQLHCCSLVSLVGARYFIKRILTLWTGYFLKVSGTEVA